LQQSLLNKLCSQSPSGVETQKRIQQSN